MKNSYLDTDDPWSGPIESGRSWKGNSGFSFLFVFKKMSTGTLTRSVCVAVLTVSTLAPIPDVLSDEIERLVKLSKGLVILLGHVTPFCTVFDSYLVIVFAWMRIVRSRSSIWLWIGKCTLGKLKLGRSWEFKVLQEHAKDNQRHAGFLMKIIKLMNKNNTCRYLKVNHLSTQIR